MGQKYEHFIFAMKGCGTMSLSRRVPFPLLKVVSEAKNRPKHAQTNYERIICLFIFKLTFIWPIFSILGYPGAFCCLFVAKIPLTCAKLNSIPLNRARGPLNDFMPALRMVVVVMMSVLAKCFHFGKRMEKVKLGNPEAHARHWIVLLVINPCLYCLIRRLCWSILQVCYSLALTPASVSCSQGFLHVFRWRRAFQSSYFSCAWNSPQKTIAGHSSNPAPTQRTCYPHSKSISAVIWHYRSICIP